MAENLHTVDFEELIDRAEEKMDSVNRSNPKLLSFSDDQLAEKLDSVVHLSTEPLSFSNLPNEILGEIVEKLDLVSRLKTRKVSRTLRSIVDKQHADYDEISICTAAPNHIYFHFDDVQVHYTKDINGCSIEYHVPHFKRKNMDGDYVEIALNDLAIALKKPKFHLMKLYLSLDQYSDFETEQVLNFFKSLKSPIHAKKVDIYNRGNSDSLEFLSLLKPGVLEEITIDYMDEKIDASRLVNMDQWKHAKIVAMGSPIVLNIKDCLHFKSFDINVDDSFSAEDVILLRDTLSKSTDFEYCCLMNIDLEVEEIAKTLGATVDLSGYNPTFFHRHAIPGSEEFLDFNFNLYELTIKRTL